MNAQKLSKASLSAFFKKNGIDVVTPRNDRIDGVEIRVYTTLVHPMIDLEMNARPRDKQVSVEARAELAVKVVKLLSQQGVQCYMTLNPGDRSYSELTTVYVMMDGSEQDNIHRYQKVWQGTIENFMAKRVAKRAAEEREWLKDEADRKAKRDAEIQNERLRRQAAAWDANGPCLHVFATILDMPKHKILVYKLRGNKKDMIFLCDCREQKSWMDGEPEWNVSVGHLDAFDNETSSGVGSTSTHGKTIEACMVEFMVRYGDW